MNTLRFAAVLALVCAVSVHAADVPAHRPRVGLVLGGGGALGFAHVGVLKSLEAQRIPIDCIGGTSMGAIVAGLYAIGMSPEEIEAFLLGLDWWDVLSDSTPRQELEFRQKEEDVRYFGLELGLKRSGLALSTGFASGQKFNNLLEAMAQRVAGTEDFDALPIPYRAVATDVEKGEMVVLSSGRVATAMRASMAVPGVFTPVHRDGRVLVDGGIVNNIPVDVVKAMGAEAIIAVDVGAPSPEEQADRADTLSDVLGRTYAIMQRPKQEAQMAQAQVLLQPATWDYSASEFHRVSELIPVGAVAADAARDRLSTYAVSGDAYDAFLKQQRRPMPSPPEISTVAIDGCERVSPRVVEHRVFSKAGQALSLESVQRDLRRMYGLGEFQQIQFHTRPQADGRTELRYDVTEKPWGPTYLRLGLKMQSDFENDARWGILLNVTRRSINARGAEWRNEAEIGNRQRAVSEFYQPVDEWGFFFVAPAVEYDNRIENVYDGEDKVAEYDVTATQARMDVGIQLRHYAELRVGPVWGTAKAEVSTGSSELPEGEEDLSGIRVRLVSDRLDRSVFPRSGLRLEIDYTGMDEDLGGDRTYDRLFGYLRDFHSIGDHTIQAGLTGGSCLGTDLPGYDSFKLGGPLLFSGLSEGQRRGSYIGVATLGYRYRVMRLAPSLGQALYVVTRADFGNVWNDSDDVGDDLLLGGSAGLGLDTIAGPILLAYGYADDGSSCAYFSLGTSF
jgi:NTE family protein